MKRLMMAALLLMVFSLPVLADDPPPPNGDTEWTWNDGGITAEDSWMRRQSASLIITILDVLP